jgi:hypothetical protein
MNDLTLNTTGAVEATLVTPATVELNAVEKLLFASRAIAGSIKKVEAADESTFDQRLAVQQLRDDVTAALSGTGDFDAASRAFKAGNNKLDRLIDTRESMLSGAKAGVKAIRDLLDAVSDQLRALED